MKFEFTGRHIEVTPALRAHVEDHFKKIEHLFDGKPAKAHVIIEVERGRHRSEVIINWRNEVLTADSSISDMYLSLSQTIGKIEKQARRLKDKVIDKSHKATKASVISTLGDRSEKAVRAPKIVEYNSLGAKPMSVDEALIDLQDGRHQFLVFRNSESGKVAVLYNQKDGDYGLIQP
jgi:putative sigma-54 modulation protein